jgi:DNA repair exonuclease SbcCD ATPase subunit
VITSLRLSNWRNYDDLVVDFAPGATFVVASNGVGKTSLVEAARYALFGVLPEQASSPVRVGGGEARVGVTLQLSDGRKVSVDRTITVKRARVAPKPSISVDGQPLSEEGFHAVVSEAFGTDITFLSRLVMPAVRREEDRPTALGLEGHLGRYFGVESLQHASTMLAGRLKVTAKQIREIKSAHAATAQQLARLEAAVEQAAEDADRASAEHDVAARKLDEIRERDRAVAAHAEWSVRHAEGENERQNLLRQIAESVDVHADATQAPALLAARIAELERDVENARVQRAVLEARTDMIAASQARLDQAHNDCPVCRRPLDDATIANAHKSNDNDLAALAREAAAFRHQEVEAVSARDRLRALQQRWAALVDAGPEPDLPPHAESQLLDVEEASAQLSVEVDRMVTARAARLDANRRLQEARDADEAMRELQRLFRVEAELQVAYDTTNATLEELLRETVRPLATEVGQRWAALFPNRGELTTEADGAMTRSVNGHDLPYDAFSTGESIGATIVLRLLVAQMATTVNFCWFDEPLEHLDPDVRRRVANILSRAAAGESGLNQIVVTTYEEALARALATRHPRRVHLIDVRQAPGIID